MNKDDIRETAKEFGEAVKDQAKDQLLTEEQKALADSMSSKEKRTSFFAAVTVGVLAGLANRFFNSGWYKKWVAPVFGKKKEEDSQK